MVHNQTQQYLQHTNHNSTSPSESEKTPLELLYQTCNSIGLPDAASKSKTILPEPLGPKTEKGKNDVTKCNSHSKAEKEKSGSKHHHKTSEPEAKSRKTEHERPSSHGSRPSSSASDHNAKLGGSQQPGQALPPTLPAAVTPKQSNCASCLPPYSMYPHPAFPGMPTAGLPFHAAFSPGSYAPGGLSPFLGAGGICRDRFCKDCTNPATLQLAAAGISRPPCPPGCIQCTASVPGHEFWPWGMNPSIYSYLSTASAATGGHPGLSPTSLAASVPGLGVLNPPLVTATRGASPDATAVSSSTNTLTSSGAAATTSISRSSETNGDVKTHECNWGGCGKSFHSQQELCEHVQTHCSSSGTTEDGKSSKSPKSSAAETASATSTFTPLTATAVTATPATSLSLGLPMNQLLALGPNAGAQPGRISPKSSYLNSLSLASALNNRYHPYGKPPTAPVMGGLTPSGFSHLPFLAGGLNPAVSSVAMGAFPFASPFYGHKLSGTFPHT